MGPDTAFPENITQSDIAAATCSAELRLPGQSPARKSNHETWQCAWAPHGDFLAWSCGKCIIKLIPWNKHRQCPYHLDDRDGSGKRYQHGGKLRTLDTGALVFSVAFGTAADNASGPCRYRYRKKMDLIVAIGLRNGKIRTYDVQTGQLFLVLMDHTMIIQDLAFAPDGSQRLLSASRDGTLKLWHLDDDGNMSRTFRCMSKEMRGCCWSPDSTSVCGVGDNRGVYLWDMETFSRRQLKGHVNSVCSCQFSPDGAVLATASYDTTVILWEPLTGQLLRKLHHMHPAPREWMVGGANDSYVRTVSFSANGRYIATVCDDGFLRMFDIFSLGCPVMISDISNAICAKFSPDGSAVAVGTRCGSVSVWWAPEDRTRLEQLCRVVIRRANKSAAAVENLQLGMSEPDGSTSYVNLPLEIQRFLKYEDLL